MSPTQYDRDCYQILYDARQRTWRVGRVIFGVLMLLVVLFMLADESMSGGLAFVMLAMFEFPFLMCLIFLWARARLMPPPHEMNLGPRNPTSSFWFSDDA